MYEYKLKLELKSDTLFGRGDGVAGLVNAEVEHDEYGMPYLRGRTLKGLLLEEADNLIFALDQMGQAAQWKAIKLKLFGPPGASLEREAILHIGDARLPEDLRRLVIDGIKAQRYTPTEVLESLTTIRRQTAVNANGAADDNSLRAVRLILRETYFEATLTFVQEPAPEDLAFLSACAKALRRAGTGRNRGMGWLRTSLCDAKGQELKEAWETFKSALYSKREEKA